MPHPSRAVGRLGCEICRAEFLFEVTADLTCAKDVKAALTSGDNIRWLPARHGLTPMLM